MRLICPCCGAMASAEAWVNDGMARASIQLVGRIPSACQDLVLPYLGLFRTGKNGLTWTRAYKLIAEVQRLVESGSVQWDGGETRPCPPHVWAQAFQAVLERRPTALSNHNYLRKTAWDMAQGLASHAEMQRERERQGLGDRTMTVRGDRAEQSVSNPFFEAPRSNSPFEGGSRGMSVNEDADDPPATEEQRRQVQDMLRAFVGKFGG